MEIGSAKTLPSDLLLRNLVQGMARNSSFKTGMLNTRNFIAALAEVSARCLPANGTCGLVSCGKGTSLCAGPRNKWHEASAEVLNQSQSAGVMVPSKS